jgi:carboxylate-amine ligase
MPGNLDDVLGIAALTQCLIKALGDEIDRGAYQHDCHPMMVRQNKWRACRYGREASLVNTYTFEVQTVSEAVEELLGRLRPTARQLGCAKYLEHVMDMARSPGWSDLQRSILDETNDRAEVVRRLSADSRLSVPRRV